MFPQQKCDHCDAQATFHLTEIQGDGQKLERHLCEPCAKQMQSTGPQKFLKTMDPAKMAMPAAARGAVCPRCGMSYAEFKQHGRFGCDHDYEIFGKELRSLFKRIHGDVHYSGKTPDGGSVDAGPSEESLRRTRKALQLAVKEERYEDAAELRDEIRRLESEPEGP